MRVFRPVLVCAAALAIGACSSTAAPRTSSGDAAVPTPSVSPTLSASPTPSVSPTPSASAVTSPRTTAIPSPRRTATPSRPSTSTLVTQRLPVAYPTGSSRQVITVVAPDRASTTATLQAWQRSGSGWRRVGPSVPANLGSAGSTTAPSESRSATPVGAFTLTRSFGHDADPGTRLPYTRTTPADWWISQPGALYNTMQRCSSHCPFTLSDPNEHLYYETPAYDYAVVIDYNTANAGGVKQGAGSAFFLHVSQGAPTAGCVSIPVAALVRVMRWLDPAASPRILIGS